MSQQNLYPKDLDDSIGTIITDNIAAVMMLFFSFSIWMYSFVNKKSYKVDKKLKLSSKIDISEENDTHIQINNLQNKSLELSCFTGVVMFSYALMFLFGGLVHKKVHDIELEVNSSNYFLSNSTARQLLLPSRCLWAVACIFVGCTSSFLAIISYLETLT